MANSLFPAAVRIAYHSVYGPHTMTLPTTEWLDVVTAGNHGVFNTWVNTTADADVMIKELVNLMKLFFIPTTVFDNYTILTLATPTAPALPQTSGSLAIAGTNPGTGWTKAAQITWSFRTAEFGDSKLVFLDGQTEDNWDKVTDPTGIAPVTDLIAKWTLDSNGWSGRDNARPATFVQIAYTLNEKLRRSYRMN